MSTASIAQRPWRTYRRYRLALRRWIAKRRKTKRYIPVYTLWRSWCDEVTIAGKFLIGALLSLIHI